jgi:vitamin B12 transporter
MRRWATVSLLALGLATTARGGADWTGGTVELEEVVVTATRTPLRPEQVASSLTVLDRTEILRSGARDLAALLEQVPGLDVSRAGGPGGTATLRMRGLGDGHVLLLVDGVEQNDPSSPGRAVDLSTLSLDGVERVEVVRGPQSALFGADALAGVVQVVTRPGGPRARASLGVGSHGRRRLELDTALGAAGWGLALAGGREELDGVSAAASPGGDADGMSSQHGRLRLERNTGPWRLALGLSGEATTVDMDVEGGAWGDDPNYEGRLRQGSGLLEGGWRGAGGDTRLSAWTRVTGREYDNRPDPARPGESLAGRYDGRVRHLGLEHVRELGGGHQLLAALEWEQERAQIRSLGENAFGPYSERVGPVGTATRAVVLQDRWSRGPLFATLGLRHDSHEREGDQATGRLTAGWSPAHQWLLRGSLGTGFKAPSLYQMHSPWGSPDLRAEHARGWDVGVEGKLGPARLSAGWFRNDVKEQIEFGPAWSYVNLGRAVSHGVELDARVPLMAGLEGSVRVTRQTALDGRTGDELLRRPRLLGRLALDASRGTWSGQLACRAEGPRRDLDFSTWPATGVTLGGFAALDLSLRWRAQERLALWGRVDNLLDHDAREVLGYADEGRVWRLGVDLDARP